MVTSLNWLVRQYPQFFYPQEWYRTEPFAQAVHDIKALESRTAADFAYAFIFSNDVRDRLMTAYVLTSDVDHEGNKVYVGRAAQYGGLQIHRLLTPEIEE